MIYQRKIQENYSILAKYYDALLQDEDSLKYWLKYINNEDFDTVLELASGSGVMANILKSLKKDIIASDISNDMKQIARTNYDGEYRIIDMSNFSIEKKFDLVLCICDSINYLEYNLLKSCFKSVYDSLNVGGRFIFDLHDIKRLQEFKDQYIEENSINGINYQWSIISDLQESTIMESFAFYEEDGTIEEYHKQYVHDSKLVIKLLNDIGFEVEFIKDFIIDEKNLYIGRKI